MDGPVANVSLLVAVFDRTQLSNQCLNNKSFLNEPHEIMAYL